MVPAERGVVRVEHRVAQGLVVGDEAVPLGERQLGAEVVEGGAHHEVPALAPHPETGEQVRLRLV